MKRLEGLCESETALSDTTLGLLLACWYGGGGAPLGGITGSEQQNTTVTPNIIRYFTYDRKITVSLLWLFCLTDLHLFNFIFSRLAGSPATDAQISV